MNEKISEFLGGEKDRVNRYLNSILPTLKLPPTPRLRRTRRQTGLPQQKDNLKNFSAALRYAVFSGGKRVRPILLLHAYRLCGGKGKKALPAAVACELIHTFSLIQDDLPSMDNDDLRREKPTLHRAYPEYTALLASDYLLILAFKQLIENYPAKISLSAINAIGLDGLTAGQFLDLTHLSKNPTVKILEEIRQKKTAALFELVFKLGALIAGEKTGRVNLLTEYGRNFGMAFQIRDDLNDAEKIESPAVMKKKITLLVGKMQKIERKLKISSPLLAYFRKFLQDASRNP